jgi:hypothetical protein
VLSFAFLLNLGSVWRFIMIVLGAQGRYLMPTIPSSAVLLMLGLGRLLPRTRPERFGGAISSIHWRPVLAAVVGAAHLALTLISLFVFILPAYAKPGSVRESELPEDMTRLDLSFVGTPIELLGGHIEVDSAHPGDLVSVSLYWRTDQAVQEDVLTFIQILGRDKEAITGVDCYPGRGNFPPSLWQPDVIYRDRYRLSLPPDAQVPTVAALYAGLYDEDHRRLPMIHPPDDTPLDMMLLDLMPIRPVEPVSDQVGHSVGARLGEAISLVGYDVSEERVRPGDALRVTLVWRANRAPKTDYTVFVHLMDERDALVSQSDHPPLDGAYPTSFWTSEDVIRDPHVLTIDRSARPGLYSLVAGMYDSQTRRRLPAQMQDCNPGPNVRIEDDAIVVGQLIVE